MLLLAVDTSSAQVSVAVAVAGDDGQVRVLATREAVAANRHGELLAQGVHDAVAEAGVAMNDLDAVAVGLGPGPFTGLRVGVVTVAAFADALGIPAYGACSLDAIALRHNASRPFLVCSDARRKQVYWAGYDATGTRVDGPDIATPADLARRFAGRVTDVVGAGALLYRDQLHEFVVHADDAYPSAADVVRLVAARAVSHAPGDALEPLYLRRPDAVPPGAPKAVTPA